VITTAQLLAVALATALIIVVPGPSVLFVVGRALSHGRAVALASVAGNAVGSFLAAVLVAVGLGPVLERSDLAFSVVKLAGAGYLLWLGVQAIRHADRAASPVGAGVAPVAQRWRAVRAGFVVGVTNPKVFVLFAAVLPQFVDRSAGSVAGQMLLLALVPVVIGLVTDSVWGVVAGSAREWFASSPRRLRAVSRAGGVSLIGVGISVAVTGRAD
jgi:threonine/homoserine/homoserine lactone efflux protein